MSPRGPGNEKDTSTAGGERVPASIFAGLPPPPPDLVRTALAETWRYCLSHDWSGYDPYDGLMSTRWPFTRLTRSRTGRLVLTQAVRRMPINVRPLLGVPRLRNPKALALGLSTACRLAGDTQFPEAAETARRLAADLVRGAVRTKNGLGWGYPFDWQGRTFFAPANTPTSVCTGFVVRALHEYAAGAVADDEGARAAREAIAAAAGFVLGDLNRTAPAGTGDDGFCFSYSPVDSSCVVNATLLAAEICARASALTGDRAAIDEAAPTVLWALARQEPDGSWAYGTARHLQWEDGFHTGFNLASLAALRQLAAPFGDPDTLVPPGALVRGTDHYVRTFIEPDGRPRYYRHSPYPADAHAAAVAVLTVLALDTIVPDAVATAGAVVDWTLSNLWRPGRGFVFRQGRVLTFPTVFLRWSQAWMLLALASWSRRVEH